MKVLIATDGSESSNASLTEAFKMIKNTRDTLDIITVDSMITSPKGVHLTAADQVLARCEQRCIEHGFKEGINLNKRVLYGKVKDEILRYINECGPFDMVIVGSRGLSSFKKLVLGSVSEYLVHHSPIPVYVVKADGSCKVSEPTS